MAANPSLHDVAMTAFQIGGGLAPSDAEVARWCKAFPEFAEDFEMAAHLARGDFDYLEQRDTDHDHTSWLVEKYVTNLMKRITAGWDANVTP